MPTQVSKATANLQQNIPPSSSSETAADMTIPLINSVNIEDPHEYMKLEEHEMEEIMARNYMNPDLVKDGNKADSNQILEQEQLLIEQKKDKCIELFKQN